MEFILISIISHIVLFGTLSNIFLQFLLWKSISVTRSFFSFFSFVSHIFSPYIIVLWIILVYILFFESFCIFFNYKIEFKRFGIFLPLFILCIISSLLASFYILYNSIVYSFTYTILHLVSTLSAIWEGAHWVNSSPTWEIFLMCRLLAQ